MGLPSAIRDASPDAWGRRVILNQLVGKRGAHQDTTDLSEATYLLSSSSDRIGALDFQEGPDKYVHRGSTESLPSLQEVAELVSAGKQIPEALRDAAGSGTGIGGARPKSYATLNDVPSMIKFTVQNDVFPVVQAEAVASRLAFKAGLNTPSVSAESVAGRYALISERFDRPGNGLRRMVVSALTFTGRNEQNWQAASYLNILDVLREHGDGSDVGSELFQRIAFNMLISNNDDHMRNHAAFWDGEALSLTPTYDLAPAARREEAEAFQSLAYTRDGTKLANLKELLLVAGEYDLTRAKAKDIITNLIETINSEFDDTLDEMQIGSATKQIIAPSFLHNTIMHGWKE